ncbi:hypothetical protein OXPF_16510 [Oxobacter pfennigii]|uniref:Protein Veg n=1 Tax=Oxobacter pfennigii TaxID=36849 RepID=A0A0N8NTE0_9CLOT|nr:Veg family protein [Oxobacter pfennigii]KPU44568.1 hypothetical protein OXPF_16510 [Oxobacter pfennigii]
MKGKEILNAIRKEVDSHVGEKVMLKANGGRKKVYVKEGILEKAYPNIFVVRIEGKSKDVRTVSYSYSDILTETVQLIFSKNKENIAFN